jgi:hypothetical protein
VRPPLPGVDAAGVFGVQTLDDGAVLLADLDRVQPRRAATGWSSRPSLTLPAQQLEQPGNAERRATLTGAPVTLARTPRCCRCAHGEDVSFDSRQIRSIRRACGGR